MPNSEQMRIKLQLDKWDKYNSYLLSELAVLHLPPSEREKIGNYDTRRDLIKRYVWKTTSQISFLKPDELTKAYHGL